MKRQRRNRFLQSNNHRDGRRDGNCWVSGCRCWRGAVGATTHLHNRRRRTTSYVGQTREYWIVAEDVLWDYAPSYPINLITGEPFDDAANVFVQPGPDRIGHAT